VADYVALVSRLARLRSAGPAAWGAILALFCMSLAVRLLFGRYLDATPLAPFLPGLPIAALLCGWRKAAVLMTVSLVASLATTAMRTQVPLLALSISTRSVVFLALGGFSIALVEALAQALQRLEAAAQLNADLFRELQHRVANNFQIVAATLQKARRNIADPAAVNAIDHAVARVASLGSLHRRLYDPSSYEAGLEPILREVLDQTFRGAAVKMQLDVSSERLSVGQMTTITLLVNEAAINAAKHAFAARRGGRFVVSLDSDGPRRLLTIADDGPGFKVEEDESAPRYGLSVMRGLAAQLGGALEIHDANGAMIRVAFTAQAPAFPRS
jgi:two-component sensor histidine kinase